MRQTNHQIIIQQTLHNDILINFGQVEVNRQAVHHLGLLVLEIVGHYGLQLRLRDVFYLPVLDEFL